MFPLPRSLNGGRIGIAGGDSKHAAIRAAVIGGWVNVLLTDTGTAAALLQQ
ncbi:MAG TPA: sugar-binding domain-containing protein [Propionibacteriaceae bacterium]|nr:sugar-binding domain-containing protein [Propionibacteriaceae bacterium]